MAENGDAELKATRREELRHGLITSSTKRRIAELSALQQRSADNGECCLCANGWRVAPELTEMAV
jgi:hypothetical protein